MAVGNVKAFQSLVSGQDSVVRHMDRPAPKPANGDQVATTDSYQSGSKGRSLESLQNGGKTAGKAQFKAPRRTLFG